MVGEHVDCSDDTLILEYINSLLAIEILRNCDPNQITLMSAYTFGQDSNAVWKDDVSCVKTFFGTHKADLADYNRMKIVCLLNKLNGGLEKLGTLLFTNTPFTPQEVNTIVNGLEEIYPSDDNYRTITPAKFMNYRNHEVVNNFDLELMTRTVMNVFNSFTGERRDLDTRTLKKAFGQHRHEIVERRTYVDFEKITKLVSRDIAAFMNKPESINKFSTRFMADIFGLLYRLRVPGKIHPNRLERLYAKYILTNDRATAAIEYSNKFTMLEPIDVVSCHLLPFNEKFVFNDILPHEMSIGNYTFGNTIEQYLVSQYILQK